MSQITEQTKKLQFLKDYFLEVYKEYVLLEKESKHIYHQYYYLFGEAIYKRYQSYILCMRLRRKLELCRVQLNRQEPINYDQIEKALDEELEEHFERLKGVLSDYISSSKYFMNEAVSDADLKEIRKIFYKIAHKIHPDITGVFGEAEKDLWEKALDAYERNDLNTLKECADLVEYLLINEPDIKADDLAGEINKFEQHIDNFKQKSKNIIESFPYNLKGLLHDNDYVAEKLSKLESDDSDYRKKAEEYLTALADITFTS